MICAVPNPTRCPCCGRARKAEGRAMCFGCMEAQLKQNQTRQARWKRDRVENIEQTEGIYDYARAKADRAD